MLPVSIIPTPAPPPSLIPAIPSIPLPSSSIGSDFIQTLFVRFLQDGLHLWNYWLPFLAIRFCMDYVFPIVASRADFANDVRFYTNIGRPEYYDV